MENKYSTAQLQEYWDACLISGWRNFHNYGRLKERWEAITGEKLEVHRDDLKRIPKKFLPYKVGARVFVASYLPKINNRLLAQPAEKDVELLKKLQTSSYDTEAVNLTRTEQEMRSARTSTEYRMKRLGFEQLKRETRNHATDWGVTK